MLKNWRFWVAVKQPQNKVLIIEEDEPGTTYIVQSKQKPLENRTKPLQNTA
jgi:hypothetical protein